MNVTKYRQEMQRGLILAVALLTMVSMVVFGSSFFMVRSSARHLSKYQGELEEFAITDPLTGIANRRHLNERGEEEFLHDRRRNGQKQDVSLGCIMVDIDHFKRINDVQGHLAGDQVIRELAQRLKQCMRPYDIVGRFGGEEFVMLLPDISFENCRNAAERIRHNIRCTPFQVETGAIPVTISIGIACSSGDDACLNDLINRADQGMYKAKESGRDQVAWICDKATANPIFSAPSPSESPCGIM
jgi:diguanylate cyclase (GGDEF)-like protein